MGEANLMLLREEKKWAYHHQQDIMMEVYTSRAEDANHVAFCPPI